ncbi:sn-glycerol-1-phosphate dehydrogenase [Actibacterium sp. 188UL27-1]|nr:sn-glycerol-1-phosphate dehydrogenase [Actibacterium sp. 188UL27-1]MBM7068687.1 sn-glycerol-1-phosphate dehydrogenase [Actibacterium sp. 188UL27-1]
MSFIEDVLSGAWTDPQTGVGLSNVPFENVRLDNSLDGAEADLVANLGFSGKLVIVSDTNTHDAMGARVAKSLGNVDEIVLNAPHADLKDADDLARQVSGYDHLIAVGSGTVNDLCKYVTAADKRRYCVFATAPSMDGYASTTASMTLPSGLKTSVPAHAASGIFIDIDVSAKAPARLRGAGFGDSVCRSVCQIDWWMSHRLLGSFYMETPYTIAAQDERRIMEQAAEIGAGTHDAIGYLHRALLLSGLGVAATGVSNHGSMGEHQISHYIDCFAGDRHPGTFHGEQVGYATMTMARLQHQMLASDTPPKLKPTPMDEADMARRMGPVIGAECAAEYRKKALDAAGADAMNGKLAKIWDDLRTECAAFTVPVEELERVLKASGCPVTAEETGLDPAFYREAVRHGHEMRNRYSFADLACDSGILDDFAAGER